MTVVLPAELWYQIARYLLSQDLQLLYGVNRTFFDLAMCAKYGMVTLGGVDNKRMLEFLRNPIIGERVRSLNISLPNGLGQSTSPSDKGEPQRPVKLAHSILDRFQLFKKSRQPRSQPAFRSFCAQFFSPMKCITRSPPRPHYNTPNFEFGNALAFSVNGISELVVDVTTAFLSASFFATPTRFPGLKAFSLALRRSDPRECNDSQTIVASFVNLHVDTLNRLKVRCIPVQNLSRLFSRLQKIEGLSTLDLDISYNNADTSTPGEVMALSQFVTLHGDSLSTLGLEASAIGVIPWTASHCSFSQICLPSLRSLSFSANLLAHSWEHSLAFLKSHATSLKQLGVTGCLAPTQLRQIIGALRGQDQESMLSQLSVTMDQLDPTILDHMAEGFPRLHSLTLRTQKVACQGAFTIFPSPIFPSKPAHYRHPFIQALRENHALADWHLQDLTIQRQFYSEDLVLWGLMEFFTECIPSVTSFKGTGHTKVPGPSQYGNDMQLW